MSTAENAALGWIGGSIDAALTMWGRGDLAELPVGTAWDVVRMPRALGWKAVQQMRRSDITVGPAQHSPNGVDVLVPVGSAAAWDLPDSQVLTADALVRVPHPSFVAPRTQRGHTWIVSPQDCGPLTDADMLHEAYAAALAASHMDAAR
ncbi:hypothetical protein [Streptomyces sp. NBC_00038]|uniref:hypothetical protein n=1 Tax=Streptomyces sp. NBC_00038 TaxID=2903615 RepID=UPI002259E990|nr:hypothetical protein [Streptomyces sp. NBC_00038]MCX5562700.1 hypothetical protein [Streptomyces sp. NBC_00038]